MKIVGVGGGTGLPVLLRGLSELSEKSPAGEEEISTEAIVGVSDNGGSSGSLRQTLGIPAVGDLRNCLVALSRGNPALADVFQYRLPAGNDLARHCLGNLIVSALLARSGSLWQAVRLAADLLQSAGRVLPCTESDATLCAEFEDGAVARGESEIVACRMRIRRVWLEPHPPPAPGVLETIHSADAIVLGPGSLYTSILSNVLPAGVCEAVRVSRALKIFVCNLMTQPGETDGFTAADHLRVLQEYLGPRSVNICLLNSRAVSLCAAENYRASGSAPVHIDDYEILREGAVPVSADLLAEDDTEIRHDPRKLARLVVALTRGVMRARDIASADFDWSANCGIVCAESSGT